MNKFASINKFTVAFLLCMAGLALTACSSQKQALKPAGGMSRELKAAGLNVNPLSPGKSEKWLRALAGTYTSWKAISLSGKVKIDALPLDPSLKIYMQRGESVIISLRVPLLGEVGRAEIAPDTAMVVNRRAGCYTKIPTASLLNRAGVNLTDFQDLLLGRVFLAGSAPLSRDNVQLFAVSEAAGGNYIVTPRKQREDAEYGFTLYPDGKMLLAVAFTTDESCLLQSEYDYSGKTTSLTLDITASGKKYSGTISYDKPDYNPAPLDPVKIKPGWKAVSLKKLFTSF